MRDDRLIGTWRSDARLTLRDLRARRDILPRTQRALARIFGELELRFTRTRCYSTFAGTTERTPYSVVAKDSTSVATVSRSLSLEEDVITHYHFEGATFWIHVGSGKFREYFRRVPSADERGDQRGRRTRRPGRR